MDRELVGADRVCCCGVGGGEQVREEAAAGLGESLAVVSTYSMWKGNSPCVMIGVCAGGWGRGNSPPAQLTLGW